MADEIFTNHFALSTMQGGPLHLFPLKDCGNTPCACDAPMRMKVRKASYATRACVIASNHLERGNLTVFPGDYAPQLL